MEPIFTLPYSEWLVAEHIMKTLRPKDGYSVFAPLSRQQKGIDLVVARRSNGETKAVSLQVKYSRAYEQGPGSPDRFASWYKVFAVPAEADFIVLAALYPLSDGRGRGKSSSWWSPLFLLFDREEMQSFIAGLRTKSGKPDTMFYFTYSSPACVTLTRGSTPNTKRDFTSHAFPQSLRRVRTRLGAG